MEEGMTYTAEYRAGQVQSQIADVAELVVDIISKHVQKEHIAEDVTKTAVKKCVTEKLLHVPVVGDKHKLLHPVTNRHEHNLAGYDVAMWSVGQNENNEVNSYEGVICIRRPPGSNTCPVG